MRRCRAIGVSNYTQYHLEELLLVARIKPMVNQARAQYREKFAETARGAFVATQLITKLSFDMYFLYTDCSYPLQPCTYGIIAPDPQVGKLRAYVHALASLFSASCRVHKTTCRMRLYSKQVAESC